MKVKFRSPDMSECPPEILRFARQHFLREGSEYEVLSVIVFEGIVLVLVVDELDWPTWLPVWLFSITDHSLQQSWVVNQFSTSPEFLIGPEFVVGSLASYEETALKDPEMMRKLVALLSSTTEAGEDTEG